MSDETLEILLKAHDDASAALNSAKANLVGLTEKVGLGSQALGAFHNILAGIGMGIGMAVFNDLQNAFSKLVGLIPDLVGKGQAFASTVETIMLATGAGAEQSSRFAGSLEYLGQDADSMTLKLGVLSKYIVAHSAAMNAMGIATEDANGVQLNSITIVDNARAALDKMSAGADRSTEAMKLFGRAGLDMLPYLNLSNAQVKLLNGEMDKLGITMNDSGVVQAKAVSQEFNLFGLSVQGLANKVLSAAGPALMGFVDTLATWVETNSTAIANFVGEVATFVVGMINQITGANLSIQTFAGSLAALGATALNPTETQILSLNQQLDALNKTTTSGAGSTKAATDALKAEATAIDAQITKLKALVTEQQTQYDAQMSQISAKLGAELSTLDTAEKQHAIDEQRASLAQQMADAQKALAVATAGSATAAGDWAVNMQQAQDALAKAQAGTKDSKTGAVTVDTTSVAAAQQRIVDLNAQQVAAAGSQADAVTAAQAQIASVTQSTADFQTQITDDARKAQIAAVQAYVAAVGKAETDAVDKKKWAENEKKVATQLSSDIAAATAKGDLTAVGDLTFQLDAVNTTIIKAGLDTRNAAKQSALDKQKALIAAETAAVSSGAADQTAILKKSIQDEITALEKKDAKDKALAAAALARTTAWEKAQGEAFGDTPTGMVGLMDAASTAGIAMGISVKGALDSIAGSASTVVSLVQGVAKAIAGIDKNALGLGMIALGVATGALPLVLAGVAMEAANVANATPTTDPGGNAGPGKGSRVPMSASGAVMGQGSAGGGTFKAAGGPVSGDTPYIVGEKRPELFVPDRAGTIVPNLPAGGGVTIAPGAIVINGTTDPEATVRALMLALKREMGRQGMSLA